MTARDDMVGYLKERWIDPDAIMQAIVVNAPLLALLEKNDRMLGGRYMSLPGIRVGSQGRSANHTKARTNKKHVKTVRFDCEYVSNYHIAPVDGNMVNDTQGNENAVAEEIDTAMESALANMRKDLQHSCYGHEGGFRGVISAIGTGLAGASCRITLTNPTDSKFFEEGMVLQASNNDGSSSAHTLLDSGNTIEIDKIDRLNGYLEFASAVTTSISGLAATDFLFADGDFQSKWSGLRGWIPESDPASGDSFHGVDRTDDVLRLSGLRRDISDQPIEEGIVESLGYAHLYDCNPDLITINPVRWANFANSLGADRANRITTLTGTAGKATVSYSAIVISSEQGMVPMVSDGGCGIDEALALTRASLVIGYSGPELVHIIDDDGLTLRRGDGDDWEIEVKHRGQFGVRWPGHNMRMTLSSLS